MSDDKRLGVIAIIIENPHDSQAKVNSFISEASAIVVGRMGIPYREKNVGVLALIVDGTENEINALTGRLGNIAGVSAKATLTKKL